MNVVRSNLYVPTGRLCAPRVYKIIHNCSLSGYLYLYNNYEHEIRILENF